MVACSKKSYAAAAVLVGCLAALPGFVAASPSRVYFDRISVESGLSQSIVTAIFQDRRGFLWVGTTDGLNLFDGYEFTVYRHEPQNSRSLSHSYITTILEDHRGRLWVGTMNGLNVLEADQRSFRRFSSNSEDARSLSDGQIQTLYKDKAENIWVGTANGLNRVVETEASPSISFIRYRYEPASPQKRAWGEVSCLLEDRLGRFWVGIPRQGLFLFDREREVLSQVWPSQETPANETPEIFCLFEDGGGRVWMGTDVGMFRLDLAAGPNPVIALQIIRPKADESIQAETLIVYDIAQDPAGTLWAATYGKGLLRVEPESGTFERIAHDPGDAASLSNDFVTALAIDAAGFLWAGTSGGGLNKQNRTRERIRRLGCSPDDPLASGRNMVFAILEDGSGGTFLGTRSGLCLLSPGQNTYSLWDNPRLPGPLKSEFIRFLLRDGGGRIWIGTEGQHNGLFRFAPGSGRFDQFQTELGKSGTLASDVVTAAAVDRDGNLWVGTRTFGLDRVAAEDLAKPNPVFRHYRRSPSSASSLSSNVIGALLADRNGILWIGTHGGGLNMLTAAQAGSDDPE
ncbi:MAG: hypothetical protein OEW18_06380, partial [Candidatus Aminicenantes bacterium]|nr:hypothetical protein [Candidatus Aminicenantes bacterium]